jgi:hypothetical protein
MFAVSEIAARGDEGAAAAEPLGSRPRPPSIVKKVTSSALQKAVSRP